MPNFNQTRKGLGFEEHEDYDSDAVRFQQGYDIQQIDVEPGEKFSISRKWESAQVQCEGREIKFITKNEWGDEDIEENNEQIELGAGAFLFYEDGVTIKKLEDFDDEDFL